MIELGDDFFVLDGREPVVVTRPGSSVVVTTQGLRRPGEGPDEIIWRLPAKTIEALCSGDVILAGGARYTVLQARREARGTMWRCSARNLAAVFDTSVDVLRETSANPAAWRVLRNVPAKIDWIEAQMRVDGFRETGPARASAQLPHDAPVAPGDRLAAAQGWLLAVVAVRFGPLLVVDAVRIDSDQPQAFNEPSRRNLP